jgi:hypothetical protein
MVIRRLKHLRKLDLSGCGEAVNDAAIQRLLTGNSKQLPTPNDQQLLQPLLLTLLAVPNTSVTDASTDLIGRNLPHLTVLDMLDCPGLTEMSVGLVIMLMPNLKFLEIGYKPGFSVDQFQCSMLAKQLDKLVLVSDHLTDESLLIANQGCNRLDSSVMRTCT